MASMSGADDMVYMEYRTRPQHPLFKLRRHWSFLYCMYNYCQLHLCISGGQRLFGAAGLLSNHLSPRVPGQGD